MPIKQVVEQEEFNTIIKEAGDKLVIVDFYADWCGPCKQLAPKLEELSTKTPNAIFLKVNVDDSEEIAAQEKVSAMPTIKFFKGGKELSDSAVLGNKFDAIRETVDLLA
eukprot:m.85577 g.85577  ORF g.85577 m.85577 type:complete len:109 (+) comp14849_c0_seq5:2074-2400(+)